MNAKLNERSPSKLKTNIDKIEEANCKDAYHQVGSTKENRRAFSDKDNADLCTRIAAHQFRICHTHKVQVIERQTLAEFTIFLKCNL